VYRPLYHCFSREPLVLSVLSVSATVSLLQQTATCTECTECIGHCITASSDSHSLRTVAPCTMRTNRSRYGVKPQHEGQSANGCCSWPTLQSATHGHVCPGLPQMLLVRCSDNPCNARYETGDDRDTEIGGVNDERRKEGRKERLQGAKE